MVVCIFFEFSLYTLCLVFANVWGVIWFLSSTCIDENGENTQIVGLDMNKMHFKLYNIVPEFYWLWKIISR